MGSINRFARPSRNPFVLSNPSSKVAGSLTHVRRITLCALVFINYIAFEQVRDPIFEAEQTLDIQGIFKMYSQIELGVELSD